MARIVCTGAGQAIPRRSVRAGRAACPVCRQRVTTLAPHFMDPERRIAVHGAPNPFDRAEFAPNPRCTVGICQQNASYDGRCYVHLYDNNGD